MLGIDTSVTHTLISSDIVEDIRVYFENEDCLVSAYGIGKGLWK